MPFRYILSNLILIFGLFDLISSKNICVDGDICLPENYDRFEFPYSDRPVEVRVDLDVLQILKVNDQDFTVTFSMYFGVRWEEPRLLIPLNRSSGYIAIDVSFFENLWVPDIYIYHLKEIRSYKIFTDFAGKKMP